MHTKTNTLARFASLIVVLGARFSSAPRSAVGATIVGFVAVLGAFCFPANAQAFDSITPTATTSVAAETTSQLTKNDSGYNKAGWRYIAQTSESFNQIEFFINSPSIGATTTPYSFTVEVRQATSTSLTGAVSLQGTLLATGYTSTTYTATTSSEKIKITVDFSTDISMVSGTAYDFIVKGTPTQTGSDTGIWSMARTGSNYLSSVHRLFGYASFSSSRTPAWATSYETNNNATRIIEISPVGEIVASTTVPFVVDYFVNSAEFATSTNFEVCVSADNLELITQLNPSANSFYDCEFASASGLNSFSTTTTLNVGMYQGYVTLLVDGELLETQPFRFVVESTTLIDQWPDMAGTASTTGGFLQACETEAESTVLGYMQALACWVIDGFNSVMSWLFMPSQTSTDRFASLSLRNKMPFEYGYQMGDIWEELYTSDNGQSLSISASTTLGTITFISADMVNDWEPIPSLIRTTLAAILWLLCAQFIWRRLQRVHDK